MENVCTVTQIRLGEGGGGGGYHWGGGGSANREPGSYIGHVRSGMLKVLGLDSTIVEAAVE